VNSFFVKIFGRLSREYYFRQLFFSAIITALLYFTMSKQIPVISLAMMGINTALYPYSRFVYESIINFIVGDNIFILNGFLMIIMKCITMALCYIFAILIAPVGLTCLFFRGNK